MNTTTEKTTTRPKTEIRGPKQIRQAVTSPKDRSLTFYTGLGNSESEFLPGLFVKTKRPSLWNRFWLWVFFGMRWTKTK